MAGQPVVNMQLHVIDDAAMQELGARLAGVCPAGMQLHLQGDLGAGKTTLVRGFLRGLGHEGRVKSPTYTLVEPYSLADVMVYHLDLYRLADPEELEYIGLRDMLDEGSICLVEWPEKGRGWLPAPDLVILISYGADMTRGREVVLSAGSVRGEGLLQQLRDS